MVFFSNITKANLGVTKFISNVSTDKKQGHHFDKMFSRYSNDLCYGNIRLSMERLASSNVENLATDPISPHLHLATLELTEIKLLRLSFVLNHFWVAAVTWLEWGRGKFLSVVGRYVSDVLCWPRCDTTGVDSDKVVYESINSIIIKSEHTTITWNSDNNKRHVSSNHGTVRNRYKFND